MYIILCQIFSSLLLFFFYLTLTTLFPIVNVMLNFNMFMSKYIVFHFSDQLLIGSSVLLFEHQRETLILSFERTGRWQLPPTLLLAE